MKNIFVIILAMFLSTSLYAQVHFNVNFGSQPYWGHPGYISHRVIIYHRQPVPYNVIYRNRYYGDNGSRSYGNGNQSGYERIPLQKHDNGKHNGWFKRNNGNSYNNGNGKSNGRGNDNGFYNGNGNYNGTFNGNGNGIYNGNSNENRNDLVPDKYNGNSNEKGNDVVPDKYK
jgi:hypothetical protein